MKIFFKTDDYLFSLTVTASAKYEKALVNTRAFLLPDVFRSITWWQLPTS